MRWCGPPRASTDELEQPQPNVQHGHGVGAPEEIDRVLNEAQLHFTSVSPGKAERVIREVKRLLLHYESKTLGALTVTEKAVLEEVVDLLAHWILSGQTKVKRKNGKLGRATDFHVFYKTLVWDLCAFSHAFNEVFLQKCSDLYTSFSDFRDLTEADIMMLPDSPFKKLAQMPKRRKLKIMTLVTNLHELKLIAPRTVEAVLSELIEEEACSGAPDRLMVEGGLKLLRALVLTPEGRQLAKSCDQHLRRLEEMKDPLEKRITRSIKSVRRRLAFDDSENSDQETKTDADSRDESANGAATPSQSAGSDVHG